MLNSEKMKTNFKKATIGSTVTAKIDGLTGCFGVVSVCSRYLTIRILYFAKEVNSWQECQRVFDIKTGKGLIQNHQLISLDTI